MKGRWIFVFLTAVAAVVVVVGGSSNSSSSPSGPLPGPNPTGDAIAPGSNGAPTADENYYITDQGVYMSGKNLNKTGNTVLTVGYLTAIKGDLKDKQGLAISGAITIALHDVSIGCSSILLSLLITLSVVCSQ